MVCVIDANAAKVIARLRKQGEEFYTLDWTRMETGTFDSHVIACGGCLGTVYLIHAEQFCMYAYFQAHPKPVQTMKFMPNNSSLLLTAGNEKKIILWDIGKLSLPDYHFSNKKVAVFDGFVFSPLQMLVFRDEYLFCTTEGGLFCWYSADKFKVDQVKRQKIERFSSPSEIQFLFVDDEPVVDGIALVGNDTIATKCAQTGVIFLWKPSSGLGQIKAGKSRVRATLVDELKWSNSEKLYMNIAVCHQSKMLFAGDDKGCIWVHDCSPDRAGTSEKSESYIPGKPRAALTMIAWPHCTSEERKPVESIDVGSIINDISCSEDMKFIVAVTDSNLVCIYKLV